MKLPIVRVPGTVPPQFTYSQTVNLLQGGTQKIEHTSAVVSSMEAALCELLSIAEKLAAENEALRKARK